MAGKFVDLQEAAKMIGVTADGLVDMRSKGTIFGYRDGASWKFKVDEVERVIRERGVEARDSDSGILNANDDEFENLISGLSSKILADKAQEESEPGSVLISEQELGVSTTGQSTIIGKGIGKDKESEQKPSDSDLRLADDSSKDILGGGSDKLIEAPGNKLDLASASDVLHGSDIHIAAGSGTGDMPALQKPGSSAAMNINDDLALGEDHDIGSSDSALDEEISPKKGSTGHGSDVTLGAGDSGINLSPSDSGLSLEEEPLDLGGGSGVESLELPEDEEVVLGTEAADQDQATQIKADNEFLLSAGDTLEEDESDSGSQVIALEDSESFDQDAATMLKQEGALGADVFTPLGAEGALEGVAPGVGAVQPAYVQTVAAEPPYSVWNVLSLGVVAGMLALSGMMMVDVMLNMWSFSSPNSVSTGLMDVFVSMLGM
jgi:hypothetical protein